MADSRFFTRKGPFPLSHIIEATGASLAGEADAKRLITDVAPLDRASKNDISFFDNSKYIDQFKASNAGVCFVRPKYAAQAPKDMICLVSEDPYRCYAIAAQAFYPVVASQEHKSPLAQIDPSAKIGKHVSIEAGVVVGAHVEIGDYTSIGANAIIASGVIIGSHCSIGALSGLSHCMIADRVVIHRGVQIGQDGFGFAMGREGHVKVPQLGRVVIESDVEIGANTTIDRGAGPDTMIGAGAKIDNLVQIGHNVQIGRGAVIVAQTGISGSSHVGDGAVLAGQVGLAGHIKIGAGARIAAQAGVMTDIPPGKSYGGSPAVSIQDWHRQSIVLSKLIKTKRGTND